MLPDMSSMPHIIKQVSADWGVNDTSPQNDTVPVKSQFMKILFFTWTTKPQRPIID